MDNTTQDFKQLDDFYKWYCTNEVPSSILKAIDKFKREQVEHSLPDESKHPSFTLEDGVEIFNDKQLLYGVDLSNFSEIEINLCAYRNNLNIYGTGQHKWFSTDEAREAYIKHNIKDKSTADIMDILKRNTELFADELDSLEDLFNKIQSND